MDLVCTSPEMPLTPLVTLEGQVVVVQCTLSGSWLETIVKDVLGCSTLTQKTKTRSQSYTIR